MVDFQVLNSYVTEEKVQHLTYKQYVLVIPNLETHYVSHESFQNFQARLFNELSDFFFQKFLHIKTEKNEYSYTYRIRVIYPQLLNKLDILNNKINTIIHTFPFKFITKKRRKNSDEYVVNKIQKLNIDSI